MNTSLSNVSVGSSAGVVTVLALERVDTDRSEAGVDRFEELEGHLGRAGRTALTGRRREPLACGGAFVVET